MRRAKCQLPGCPRRFDVAEHAGRPRRYCSDAHKYVAYRRRKARSVHFSSASDDWPTPRALFEQLAAEHGPFDLDPCASPENAKCGRYYTAADDGLAQPWTGPRVWMNPPYGRSIGQWMARAARAVADGEAELVCCLVPARTDTAWWHEAMAAGASVTFLAGRVKFGDAKSGAPFPSAVVVFRGVFAATQSVAA